MIIRSLDASFDWNFGKGKQDYLSGLDALKLNILTRLRSWKGDCFFALAEGVDWNNYLDIGTKEFLDRDIKRVILQSDGVLRIDEYTSTLDREARSLTVTTTIQTIYGELVTRETF